MPDFAYGAVAIVRRNRNQNRRAARAIAFKEDLVDLAAFEFAGAAHDRALDIVGGHADGFGRGDGGPQTRIGVGITAAPGRDLNFLDQPRKRLATLGVGGGLLVLNGRPFTMSGHAETSNSEPNYA